MNRAKVLLGKTQNGYPSEQLCKYPEFQIPLKIPCYTPKEAKGLQKAGEKSA